MCILFTYTSRDDADSDYCLIIASNRDEYYDRPALKIAQWEDDSGVYGGRDVQAGGAWLALAPWKGKLGVLLNVPGTNKDNAKSRGQLVEDFVKCNECTKYYIDSMESYIKECNGFVLVTAEFEKTQAVINAFCNVQNSLVTYEEKYLGFSNSEPIKPLTKVEAGKKKFKEMCSKFNKVDQKEQLIKALLAFLKSNEKHLPDPQLEERQPQLYKEFSSIFVHIPQGRYGTRTHTLVLVTKAGHIDFMEVTLVAPIDPMKPNWDVTKYEFDLNWSLDG